ncbi:MAG: hypothetical protein ABI351_14465 [Herbaspirillum sp.]
MSPLNSMLLVGRGLAGLGCAAAGTLGSAPGRDQLLSRHLVAL